MFKQKKAGDKLETQLLRTDDKYREQYQKRIAYQLNDIDAIDQLEDRYDRFVSILTTTAQETLAYSICQAKAEIDDQRYLR